MNVSLIYRNMLPLTKNALRPLSSCPSLSGLNGKVYKRQNPLIEIDMKVKSAQRQFNYDCDDLGAWGQNNETLYPPITAKKGDKDYFRRPAEVFYGRVRARISPTNMAHCCWFVQGMNVDEAIQRCSIHKRKTFLIMADILEEAKLKAAEDHFVKFPSDMHIASATCNQDSMEYHTKFNGQFANTYRTRYTNIYVKLREGTAPKHDVSERTAQAEGERFIKMMNEREILYGL